MSCEGAWAGDTWLQWTVCTVHHVYQSYKRRFADISQSQRRPLLGPSPGWKHLLALSHLRHYVPYIHCVSDPISHLPTAYRTVGQPQPSQRFVFGSSFHGGRDRSLWIFWPFCGYIKIPSITIKLIGVEVSAIGICLCRYQSHSVSV